MIRFINRILRAAVLLFVLVIVGTMIQDRRQELQYTETKVIAEVQEEPEAVEDTMPEPMEAWMIPEIDRIREEIALPAAYDGRQDLRNPPVKDQGEMNNCWAFAGTGALEAALLPEEELWFSTDHMTYHNTYAISPEDGGAYAMAVAYLTAWKGPVTEAEDPSGDGISPDNLTAAKQVLGVRFPDYKDYNAIKQTILLYGGVESSLYMDFAEGESSSASYDPSLNSYCYMGETEPNHDVVIIGWDDSYPAENFVRKPEGDGAFICQNSWGETFGENGIFYVSYYDSNIGGCNAAYTRIENAGYFDALYQSDLCGWTGQLGYASEEGWFANVFTAGEQERLEAVGFYTTGMDSTYEVYLVPEFRDVYALNDRVFITNGYLQYAGYHTIEFDQEVKERLTGVLHLQAGRKFAVVVHLTTEYAGYPIAVEYAKDTGTEAVNILDGESYISDRGSIWSRAEEDCASNVCLKAYVNYID